MSTRRKVMKVTIADEAPGHGVTGLLYQTYETSSPEYSPITFFCESFIATPPRHYCVSMSSERGKDKNTKTD